MSCRKAPTAAIGRSRRPRRLQGELRWLEPRASAGTSPLGGVYSAHGKIYWSQKGGSKAGRGRIFRDIELLFDHLPEPIDLEIEPRTQTLYRTDRGEYPAGNTRSTADVSGSGSDSSSEKREVVTLARHFHGAIGMRVDGVNYHIYVADLGGTLYWFNMDGSGKRRIVDSESAAFMGS